ncbi:MAG: hypothetical protein ACOX6T_04090 [Myxococcales bacterium]|jgi:hypothetical protein
MGFPEASVVSTAWALGVKIHPVVPAEVSLLLTRSSRYQKPGKLAALAPDGGAHEMASAVFVYQLDWFG